MIRFILSLVIVAVLYVECKPQMDMAKQYVYSMQGSAAVKALTDLIGGR